MAMGKTNRKKKKGEQEEFESWNWDERRQVCFVHLILNYLHVFETPYLFPFLMLSNSLQN
jgi:beta-lactamase class D